MNMKILTVLILIAVGIVSVNSIVPPTHPNTKNLNLTSSSQLKKFESTAEIKTYLDRNIGHNGYITFFEDMAITLTPQIAMKSIPATESGAQDFSTTNIQVQGVDEADIVKSDGRYLYMLSKNRVVIISAYPPEDAEILSKIKIDGEIQELYINGDRLIVIVNDQRRPKDPIILEKINDVKEKIAPDMIYPEPARQTSKIYVYNVADRRSPEMVKEVSVDGIYFNSRMVDDYVYLVANQYNLYYRDDVAIPEIESIVSEVKASETLDVYYFDKPDSYYSFINIVAVNTQDRSLSANGKTYLLGSTENLYVSKESIYITYQEQEKTVIHRIAINEGEIEYTSTGEVPGRVLNQFSMDEHDGYFRIATTTGHNTRNGGKTSANHIYVLSSELEVIGALEDLAPGERIYSARFMGERAYLVTFQKVDPLFVIDLSDPENPDILGKLKIPGYSDYLHPYDENHVIGLGKDTIEAETGNFAWYQGLKLALFDVSDVEHPIEVSKVIIGDRGTDSYALRDHKAFLFSREKNLLVIPVLLAEITDKNYPEDISPSQHGEYVWQGAYVFRLDSNGFELTGRVSHVEDDSVFLKSGRYYYDSGYSVKRSLYMDDMLYTISEGMVKMNQLADLKEINKIYL